MQYGYKKQTKLAFADAVGKVRTELSKEGFGIITEINVKETFKKKLNVDFGEYIILGACHPTTAHKVLELEKDMGLLLPCNVVVYQEDKNVYISVILPTVAMGMVENANLVPIAREVEEKLKKVIDAV
ncbi:MAG: DUF302 domain-containing protein [Candidatus Moranbacteria bacterium]|nr:DUF302 domain-containing protein [Candidatus Moranbacteria bacterium]